VTPDTLPDHVIYVDVYDTQVDVCTSSESWYAWHAARDLEPDDTQSAHGLAGMLTDPGGTTWFVMYIHEGCRVETKARECLHIAWYLLSCKGIRVDEDNHEALAYLQAHLFRKLEEATMPKDSKVGRCVTKLDKTKAKGAAIAICQDATGLSYATGKKPKSKGKK